MTLSKISGRVVDLNVFQNLSLERETKIDLGFGGTSGGQQVAGVQRVAEQFVQLFTTIRGTSFFDAERGCEFLRELRAGNINSGSDIPGLFSLSASDVLDYMGVETTADTPEDEQIADAILDWHIVRPPTLLLGIRIVTIAGDRKEIILPVS